VPPRDPLTDDDCAEHGGQPFTPPVVSRPRARIGVRDRAKARRIADETEGGKEFVWQRLIRGIQRLT